MIVSSIARVRSVLRGIARTHDLDAEMRQEFQHHIGMRAAQLVRDGLPPAEAERRARVEFGGMYQYTALGRESRGHRWFDSFRFSWLDVKLGGRMLIKYPGLTVVSALAMGVAIAMGAGGFTAIALLTSKALPLHEGDRVVAIQLMDVTTRNLEYRILRDVAEWRGVRALQDVGIFRPAVRNITTPERHVEVTRGVEMSAAGFRLARVSPLLGRYLVDDDERPGAPPVLVIGYNVWRARFGGDRSIVGRTVKFGAERHTIVGVMPEGFTFPLNFDLWVPPRINASDYGWRKGPGLSTFARLAPHATLEQAQVELETRAMRVAEAYPETHRTLRPRLIPFSQSWFDVLNNPDAQLILPSIQMILTLLLVVICINVAILVYARTATRQSEIAVRSALGASRGRIVSQLFGEALALSALGGIVGLGLVWVVASRLDSMLAQAGVRGLQFWLRFEISNTTLLSVLALAVLGAMIVGVIPGLRVSGTRLQPSLQRLVGGHATVRMGRVWTGLVIAEVALAVAILPPAVRVAADWIERTRPDPRFAAEQYLSATLALEQTLSTASTPENARAFFSRFGRARAELLRRLDVEGEVVASTFMKDVPGSEGGWPIEIDSITRADSARAAAKGMPHRQPYARQATVDASVFRVFGVRLLAGRSLAVADTSANVVIVNRWFVDSLLRGHSALGRRVRTVTNTRGQERQTGPWHEIVGVVENFPAKPAFDSPGAAIYRAASVTASYPASIAVRTRGDPAAFGERLRGIALDVDPALLVRDVGMLDARMRATSLPLQWLAIALGAVTLSVLILSAAGIYALMSVTVTQRRREIGIRVALGANRSRLLAGIFTRASVQLGSGVAAGIGLMALLNLSSDGGLLGPESIVILPLVSLFMVGVGVLAAMLPARRALSIQPTLVLKED
jgi:predicted permease